MPIRVFICDDQAIIREGLTMLLNLERDLTVVGSAIDGADALDQIDRLRPDLVLMDLKMPIMNGIEATRQIRARYPDIRVLVLTTFDDDEWVFDAIRAGANGYLLKDTPRDDLIKAVIGTSSGKTFLDPAVAGRVMEQISVRSTLPNTVLTDRLTEREIDVLKLLSTGLTNFDIAQRLSLSEGTVRNHVSAILTKLNLEDRTQAAVLALRHGIVG